MLVDSIIPGFARTAYEVGPCPDGHAYLAIDATGASGWTASADDAIRIGVHVVQRVMAGRRRGVEWTIKGGWT